MGMSDLSKHPFDEIWLAPDIAPDVPSILRQEEYRDYRLIADKTKEFLRGYFSNYTLELLSTVDFLLCDNHRLQGWKSMNKSDVVDFLCKDIVLWNARKQRLFNKPIFVQKMLDHIEQYGL